MSLFDYPPKTPRPRRWYERQYYDHPDGEDIGGKLIATNKYALCAGVGASTMDVLLVSHTKGYAATISRYARITVPLLGVASAFTVITYMGNKFRGKDDLLNYCMGSIAAGGVAGAGMRNPYRGLFACAAFCVASWVKRLSREEGWEFFPYVQRNPGDFRSHKRGWSVMEDGERGWTR